MAHGTILLLEHNTKIIHTIDSAAKKCGFRLQHLSWSEDLIKHLEKLSVDIVLMNVRQMGLSVRSICQRIREVPQFQRFPLIILYGKRSKESYSALLKMGADDFIEMPFTPMDMMIVLQARIRPFMDLRGNKSLSQIDQIEKKKMKTIKREALPDRDSLEHIPLAEIFSRIYFRRETGILTVFIKKETRTIYFEAGEIIFAESGSKKDDMADFLARNYAGRRTGKEFIAARNQAGGIGCDPREFALLLKETDLVEEHRFDYWLQLFIMDMIANLFSKPLGEFQWEPLPLPDRATELAIDPISPPIIVFEGIRRMKKWWDYREKLPKDDFIPRLTIDFHERSILYGLSDLEQRTLKIIDGQASLREIRESCHRFAQTIDNYIFACHVFGMIVFEESSSEQSGKGDIYAEIDMDDIEEEKPIPPPKPKRQASKASVEKARQIRSEPPKTPEPEPELPTPISTSEKNSSFPSSSSPKREFSYPEREKKALDLTSGKLNEKPVSELFRDCMTGRCHGCMRFMGLGITKHVYWRRGKIISVTSDDIDERLDNFLFRKHIISQEQREKLRSNGPDAAGSPNEILRHHILSIEQVFKIVKEQAEAIVQDIFQWTDGSFIFDKEKTPPSDVVPMDLQPAGLIISGLRQLKNWTHLESMMPKKGDLVRLIKARKQNHSGLNLSPLELRIFNVLMEPLPVEEVIRRIGHPADEILRSLYAMEAAGLIHRTGHNA